MRMGLLSFNQSKDNMKIKPDYFYLHPTRSSSPQNHTNQCNNNHTIFIERLRTNAVFVLASSYSRHVPALLDTRLRISLSSKAKAPFPPFVCYHENQCRMIAIAINRWDSG
jgi:hypothetical protein